MPRNKQAQEWFSYKEKTRYQNARLEVNKELTICEVDVKSD